MNNPLEELLNTPDPQPNGSMVWGTITSLDPITVSVGPQNDLITDVETIIEETSLEIDDRVYISYFNRKMVIVGKLGGSGNGGGVPAGSIIAWSANTIPENWLECNGQEVSRETYSDLFAIIGVQYGVGNGSTTFNVPDLRGRTIVGHNASESEFNTLGKTGGAKTHTLTVAEMPSHGHSIGSVISNTGSTVAGSGSTSIFTVNTTAAISAAANGGGGAHNNLQPYRTEKYIIKAVGGIGALSSTVESVLLDRVTLVENAISELDDTGVKGKVPGSIITVGASASATVDDATGIITFANCTIIALDDWFEDTGMGVYKLYARFTSHHTASASIYTKVRRDGSVPAGVYNYVGNYTLNASGPIRYSVFGAGQFGYFNPGVGTGAPSTASEMTIYDPASSAHAFRYTMLGYTFASDRPLLVEGGDISAGAIDGLEFRGSAGTISGTLKLVKVA